MSAEPNGTPMQPISNIAQIQSGYYKTATKDAEPNSIFLAKNGTGYAIGTGYANITWQQKGNGITIKDGDYLDVTAKIISSSSFEIDGVNYTIDPKYESTTYNYAETDFSGQLTIIRDSDQKFFHIEFETVENNSANTCEGKFVCQNNGNSASCEEYGGADTPGAVILKFADNTLTVDTTYDRGEFCGRYGNFTGVYKK